jgi:hypothetical protein
MPSATSDDGDAPRAAEAPDDGGMRPARTFEARAGLRT